MQTYARFADIIDYPTPELGRRVHDCITSLSAADAAAASELKDFDAQIANVDTSRLEELYTAAFDLQRECTPYVGHHLFGEDRRRNLWMAQLNREYREHGFTRGNELPDHLAVMLRFLARGQGGDLADELVSTCMLPTVRTVLAGLEKRRHPYAAAFRALLLVLERRAAGSEHAGSDG